MPKAYHVLRDLAPLSRENVTSHVDVTAKLDARFSEASVCGVANLFCSKQPIANGAVNSGKSYLLSDKLLRTYAIAIAMLTKTYEKAMRFADCHFRLHVRNKPVRSSAVRLRVTPLVVPGRRSWDPKTRKRLQTTYGVLLLLAF